MTDLALPPPVILGPRPDGLGHLIVSDIPRAACRTEVEVAVHRLINRERTKRGLPKLMTSGILTATAQRWSRLMADMGSVAHAYGPTEALTEIRRSGYPNSWVGQNLYAGREAPVEAVAAWLQSDGHREAMLSTHFTEMGVGFYHDPESRYHYYWTTDFGGGDTPKATRCKEDTP
jgi:uncharacterized protein YkwD